ncbi:hypothetical protein OsccyDRAFT_3793 [Leptolyngbyaceae cyanobacterium JSC-12]|nr:hypothetical protein OsccyDRAFT_3793 [Leptolyngbyaceae cyanobacterium JSC-12]
MVIGRMDEGEAKPVWMLGFIFNLTYAVSNSMTSTYLYQKDHEVCVPFGISN